MVEPSIKRWSRPEAPTERALRADLSREGLAPYAWGNPTAETYPPHRHTFRKILVVVAGSIEIEFVDTRLTVTLGPGDRLDLPAGSLHAAKIGTEGVTCLEAHRNQ